MAMLVEPKITLNIISSFRSVLPLRLDLDLSFFAGYGTGVCVLLQGPGVGGVARGGQAQPDQPPRQRSQRAGRLLHESGHRARPEGLRRGRGGVLPNFR